MIRWPQFNKLKPRERLLAVGTGAVLLIVALDSLVLRPWIRHAQTVRREIHRMEEELRNHNRLLARRDRVLGEIGRYREYLRQPVTDDLQMAALLKEVERVAQRSGIVVGEVKPLQIEAVGNEKRYSLEVRFESTLEEWVKFVYRLETSSALYSVIGAGLEASSEKPDQLKASLRVMSAAMRPEGERPSEKERPS